MSPRAFPYSFEENAELDEARQRAERLTMNERCDEAAAMFILSLVDIARRSADADDYMARLDRDPPGFCRRLEYLGITKPEPPKRATKNQKKK